MQLSKVFCLKSYLFSSVPIILVGNKVDLHLERCISVEDGKRLADYMKADFVEVRYEFVSLSLLLLLFYFISIYVILYLYILFYFIIIYFILFYNLVQRITDQWMICFTNWLLRLNVQETSLEITSKKNQANALFPN